MVSERTAMVNKMKNKYIFVELLIIMQFLSICNLYLKSLLQVVGKVHVGPLILIFCLFVFCFAFLGQIQSQVACA